MDSPAGGVLGGIENIAGRALGTVGMLASLRGGGLINYMNARARALSDPATRATLIDSPFTAGTYFLGGGGGGGGPVAPPGQPMPAVGGVAQPEETQPGFVGPVAPPDVSQTPAPVVAPAPRAVQTVAGPQDVRYLPAGGEWYPNVAPLDYASQVKAEQDRSTMIGLTSSDPAIRTQSKLAIGVPLSQAEVEQAIGTGRGMVQLAGPGSQVQYKLPGGAMTVGSPYNLAPIAVDEFPTYDQAAAAAGTRGPGWNVEQTNRGTFKPVPPPTREQVLPAAPPPPVMRGGGASAAPMTPAVPPTPRPGGVDPFHSAFDATADKYGLPRGLLNGIAQTESSFNPAAVNKQSGAQGLMQFLPATAARYNVEPFDPASAIDGAGRYMRDLMDQTGGNLHAALQQYGGATTTDYAGPVLARMSNFQRWMAQQMSPGQAEAAPPPRAAVEAPPAFDPNAVVPHVVVPAPAPGAATVGYPSAAPEPGPGTIVPTPIPQLRTPGAPVGIPGAPPPAKELPGIPVDPTSGMPLQSRTYESQTGSETYTAPPRGDVPTQLKLRYNGISDPAIATPAQVVNYFATEQALKNNESMDKATIERMQRGMTEGESKEFTRLAEMKTAINDFLKAYPEPADRAQFLGLVNAPLQTLRERIGWQDAQTIRDFRNAFSPFSLESLTDEKGKAQPGMEGIAQMAPSVNDSSGAFESNLQHFKDALDRRITIVSNLRSMPVGEATPALVNSWVDQLQHDSLAQRLSVFPQSAAPPTAPPPAAAAPPPSTPPPPTAAAPPWQPNWVQ